MGFVAFGRRLLAMKYFVCGWYALIAMALFTIARHWLDRWLAAFSVLVWLGLAPFYNHGIMISPHVYMLLFQALATLIALRTPDLTPRRFAVVGLLAGLSWAAKQSFGVLYLAAILCWLLLRPLSLPGARRRVLAAVSASAAFVAVIAVCLAWLLMQGAIRDWYLQTIAFPRQFYLSGAPARGLMDVLDPVIDQFTGPDSRRRSAAAADAARSSEPPGRCHADGVHHGVPVAWCLPLGELHAPVVDHQPHHRPIRVLPARGHQALGSG